MICKVRHMSNGSVVEETTNLQVSSKSSTSEVIEAGRAFVNMKECGPGVVPGHLKPKLLSVKRMSDRSV